MHAGSWQFPGSTLIHLCPVWGQEGLRPTGNLVIANYISKAFCCCSLLLPPAPLSWLPWVVTSSCLLLLPSTILPTPPTPPALVNSNRGGLETGQQDVAGSLLPAPSPYRFLPAVQGHLLHLPDSCQAAPKGTAA